MCGVGHLPDLSGSTAETTQENTVLSRHFVPVISWQRNSKDMAPLPLNCHSPQLTSGLSVQEAPRLSHFYLIALGVSNDVID